MSGDQSHSVLQVVSIFVNRDSHDHPNKILAPCHFCVKMSHLMTMGHEYISAIKFMGILPVRDPLSYRFYF